MPPSPAQKRSLEELHQKFEAAGPTNLQGYLQGRGLGVAVLERFRLGYVEPDELVPKHLWHRMAIPYDTPTGIVQIRYKCLLEHHAKGGDSGQCPKMIATAGDEVTLYNARAVLDARGPVFICEGEPDVWAVETLLGRPAVGVPGAHSWTKYPHWPRCFVGLDLILPVHGDSAGDDLAKVIAHDLPETKVVRLPDGEDALSLLASDPDRFTALVA